jgi:hypothetical protein
MDPKNKGPPMDLYILPTTTGYLKKNYKRLEQGMRGTVW